MRLLIDEMFPPGAADQLRGQYGHDVVWVGGRSDLRGLPDADIFAAAQEGRRALVTENARDLRPIAREWQAAGKVHFGLILTSNRRCPRAQPATLGRLVIALDKLLANQPAGSAASNLELWLP